jgi:hypothetical protein
MAGIEWNRCPEMSYFRHGGHDRWNAGLHHSPRAGQEWEELVC